ncbi:MAG TPA: lysylphosphatidylglycerol synthase transmembrane domain-containing protein [Acidimicrobiales bacterium]|nr:lysylphosphatidylglycerol synthase transmembrane domain-containing protein [Acidimicrobiales bacterium]
MSRSAPDSGPPTDGDTEEPDAPRKKRHLFGYLPRPVWHLGRLLILALLIEYLVLPQLAGPRKLITLLDQVDPIFLLVGVACEAGALMAYAMLTRSVLPPTSHVGLFTIFRIELTTLSVSHCAPGGTAAGAALGYRLLTQFGAEPGDAGFALGVQGIGSALVLNVLLWLALVVSIPVWGFSPEYLLAAVVGAALLLMAGLLVYALTRGEDRVGAMLQRAASHVPFVDGAALRRSYGHLAEQLSALGQRREAMIKAVVWAALNWILDAASLEVFVGAFGHWVNPDGLMVSYGLANVLAAIPLTPGGLGVVEAALTTLLVGFGTTRGVATLGVIVYRLFQFWAPIPLGGLAYLSLQASRVQDARARREADTGPLKMPFKSHLSGEVDDARPQTQ